MTEPISSKKRMKTLLRIIQYLNSVRSEQELYDYLTGKALELTGAEKAILFLLDADSNLEMTSSKSKEINTSGLRFSRSVIFDAINNRNSIKIIIDDKDEPADISGSIEELNLKTVMCAPLMKSLASEEAADRDTIIHGVLYVDGPTAVKDFGDEDQALLNLMAGHAAAALENILYMKKIEQEKDAVLHRERARFHFQGIIGECSQIKSIYEKLEKFKEVDVEVLITGETGTGKELIAKTLHYNSPRNDKPFIKLNCAALPSEIVEAELFGIEKAIATGVTARKGKLEAADGGTLFLDEIADMSLEVQGKLLHFLQSKRIRRVGASQFISLDVKIVAATNKNIQREIEKRAFRKDLFYRINTVTLDLPPLRERGDDVFLLAGHFLVEYCNRFDLPLKRFSEKARESIKNHQWPGNIRELMQSIQRAVVLSEGNVIHDHDLQLLESTKSAYVRMPATIDFYEMKNNLERTTIENMLTLTEGNISRAAEILSITRRTLYNKIEKYGIKTNERLSAN